MRSARLVLLLAALAGASPAVAQGSALGGAKKAYADLSYESCRDQAKTALDEPAGKAERVDAYRLLGLCHAALGDTDDAYDAFLKMLALDTKAELPAGLSPRFTSSYLEAKGAWVGKTPLDLVVEDERADGKSRVVRVHVIDGAELIDKVTWEDDEGERRPPLKAAERMELVLPTGVDVRLLALDVKGGVVVEKAIGGAPKVAEPVPPPPPDGGAEESGGGPWLWIGVAAGAGVIVAGGAAAAIAGVLLAEPSSVTLESQVAFGNE